MLDNPTRLEAAMRQLLPVGTAALIALLSVWLWWYLVQWERRYQHAVTETEAASAMDSAEQSLDATLFTVERMAHRWQTVQELTPGSRRKDARLLVEEQRGILAVLLTDPAGVVQWNVRALSPQSELETATVRSATIAQASSMDLAANRAWLTVSPGRLPDELVLLATIPLFEGRKLQGFLVGAIDSVRLLSAALQGFSAEGWAGTVSLSEWQLYRFGPQAPVAGFAPDRAVAQTARIGEATLVVKLWPAQQPTFFSAPRTPLAVLLAGILVALLVGVSLHFYLSRRRHLLEALRASGELDRFFSLSLDLLCVAGTDGYFKRINPAFEDVLGYSTEELLAVSLIERVHPEDRERTLAAVADLAQGQSIAKFENRYRCKDGSYRLLEWRSAPDPGHGLIYAAARDVSEQRNAEQALRDSHEQLEQRVRERTQSLADTVADLERTIGQRDRYQNEMVASESKFRDLIEGSLEGILIHGNLKPLFCNAAYARLHGYDTPEEVLALDSIMPFYAPQEQARIMGYLEQRMRGGPVPTEYEYEGRTKDGHMLWVMMHAKRIEWDGRAAVQSTLVDITERKQAETSLREREQQLTSIYQTTGDIIFHLELMNDGGFRFISVNKAFVTTTGIDSAQVIGKSVSDIIPEPSLSLVLEKYREAIRERKIVRWEEASDYPTGRLIGDVSVAPVFDESGNCTHLVGSVHDITKRKQAEEELRESEEKYRILVEGSLQGIMIVQGGKIVHCNQACARMFGHDGPADLIGTDAINVVHPDDRHEALQTGSPEMRTGNPRLYRYYRGLRKDGTDMWYEPHRDDVRWKGRRAVLWILIDVTESRVLQQQLEQAQRMDSVGRLAGGIAHDFNNMLAVILSYGNFVLEAVADQEAVREDVQQIITAANRSAALTRQLLAFSRRQVLKLEDTDVNTIVAGMEKMLRRLIGEDVQFSTQLASGLGIVRADASQLEQVLLNLAVNARDAMPMGGQLTIETGNVDLDEAYVNSHIEVAPGPYVMVSVSDTGTGMDEATRERIFEPFFTTKEQGKGTGLGLATVYGIVKQLGGSIFVYSELGHGTTFKIYLPRTASSRAAAGLQSPSDKGTRASGTILLVEDEEQVRAAARRVLESAGYRVLEAADGNAALALAERQADAIDLLLTDVVMPKMSGAELAAHLLALRPGIHVLYMTGYTEGAISQHGVLKEGVQVVFKPFSKASLLEEVWKAMGHA